MHASTSNVPKALVAIESCFVLSLLALANMPGFSLF